MFSNPPQFLLLVPVAVFFPRLSHYPFYSSSFWGDWSAPWLVAHDGLNPLGEGPHVLLKTEIYLESIYFDLSCPADGRRLLYLMEEVLINHIFNPLDFWFVCCCRKVQTFRVFIQELLVLWLEVFRMSSWRRMAVQKFSLQGRTHLKLMIKCNFWGLISHSWRIITQIQEHKCDISIDSQLLSNV